ncbi:hypothetical protein TI03_04215 [Achromatium sp. WMS1]|nr:hypothetical protein TI03_04215 [Achromatium sp. WMS1]
MEDTHLTQPDRISKLFAIVTLAFVWCYRVGLWQSGVKLSRICKHGYRAKSFFKQGVEFLQRMFSCKSVFVAFWDVVKNLFPISKFDESISLVDVL